MGRIFLPDKNKIKDCESGITRIFIICNLKLLTSLSGIWWSQHGNELEKQEMHTDFQLKNQEGTDDLGDPKLKMKDKIVVVDRKHLILRLMLVFIERKR